MNASARWTTTAGPQLRAAIVRDLGTRLEHDNERDSNGDITAFANWRAVLRAKLVDCDLRLVVDVDSEPKDRRLDGLSITRFEGLNESEGTAYAVFKGGRALPLITYQTTPITDPQEITARELALARIQSTKKSAQDRPWRQVLASFNHRYMPPQPMPLFGAQDCILRGKSEHYLADDGKPFVFLEWDTATHRHRAGFYPREGDEGLTLDQLEAVPTYGRLLFSGGREYATGRPRGVVELTAAVGFEELPPAERTANLAEIGAYGFHPRNTGARGARGTPTEPGELETGSRELTTKQAAAFANVSEKTILNWLHEKDEKGNEMLPRARRFAGQWRIPEGDLIQWRKAERRTREPQKAAKKQPSRKRVK